MLYIIMLLAFASSFLIFRALLDYAFQNRKAIQIRLSDISKQDAGSQESELSKPLFTRVFQPLLDSLGRTVMKITPKEITASLEKKIIMAGRPERISVKNVMNMQAVTILGLPLLTAAAGYYSRWGAGPVVLFILAEIAVGLVMPGFLLGRLAGERQKKILNSLPDVIDLLTVSVEAGLGFDGALVKVIDKMPGPLAAEFENVLQEIKVGKLKREALRAMADRVGLQDLTAFVGSIIQADQFGVGIGNVLRIQSAEMRRKRKQRAQEKAMKAPIKMLMPMVFFIFPRLFTVLLGPVVLQLLDQFSK